MNLAAVNERWAAWLIQALVDAGLKHVCLSPGSRSAPLALAVARQPGLQTAVLVDERVAGFVALGIGKVHPTPAALICTSGSAAANYFPAIVEAHYSRTPLVVLTADRPPELRDTGAWQAIDQLKLFGPYVRWFAELGPPTEDFAGEAYVRSVAARAVSVAMGVGGPPGPVHVNLAFREPLVDVEAFDTLDVDSGSAETSLESASHHTGTATESSPRRTGTIHRPSTRRPRDEDVERVVSLIRAHPHGVILGGRQRADAAEPADVARLAALTGYPVLADASSNLRFGEHDRGLILTRYEAVLRAADWWQAAPPTLIIQLGASFTWKHVTTFLEQAQPNAHLVIDGDAAFDDPARLAHEVFHTSPREFVLAVADRLRADATTSIPTAWQQRWLDADAVAARVADDIAANTPASDDSVIPYWRAIISTLPPRSDLFAANSMAVRDLDSFSGSAATPIRTVVNRGAAGIDGNIATASGMAWASGQPTVAVVGDLALVHDLGALAATLPPSGPLVVICFNDGGGGIFEYLPVASAPRTVFERFFGSPVPLDLQALASAFGADHNLAYGPVHLSNCLRDGTGHWPSSGRRTFTILEVTIDREANTAAHRQYWRRVVAELSLTMDRDRQPSGQ